MTFRQPRCRNFTLRPSHLGGESATPTRYFRAITPPGPVAPGTYHLMIATRFNNQSLVWDQAVQVRPGANSITIDTRNATPLN
jgi:hypothetical protein